MKLIINASGTKATGATQVTISFLKECINFTENTYYVFLSKTVAAELELKSFPTNFNFYVFSNKPFFNFKGIKVWLKLSHLENEIKPDCVFSVFGPSVWKPKSPHLMGYAYPYYVYPESPFFKIISLKKRIEIYFHKIFHKYLLEKNGKYYVCETEDVSQRLPDYINCNPQNIFTITNTYNHFYNDYKSYKKNILPKKDISEFRLVTLSSFALHKNLSILNEVIPILKQKCPKINFKFILTVNKELYEVRFTDEVKSNLINLGRIKIEKCPQIYYECDAMFLPTLMECFSASYAESMIMGKPILTSDLAFAKTVCADAALYFNPMDPENIADKIIQIAEDEILQNELINRGLKRLQAFDTAYIRAKKNLEICKKISLK